MVTSSEGYEGRSTVSLVRVQPVDWDGVGRVAVFGEIDLTNVRDVDAALSYMAASSQSLALDLVGLSHLNSRGVLMLFRLAQRALRNGGSLTLANPQNLVRRIIQITHLDDAVVIIDDV
jgi:anti-sigma B factor antagonist